MLTLQQMADKYQSRLGASQKAYQDGINGVTESPMAKAVAQLDVAKQNYIQAIDSGRMAAGLNNVTLAQWKQAATSTGASRLAASAPVAKEKWMKRMQVLMPDIQAAAETVRRMPKGTLEYGKARALAMIDAMAALKGKR